MKRLHFSIAIIVFLAVVLLAGLVPAEAPCMPAQQASGRPKAPRAVFPETRHDVGEVKGGTDVTHTFKVKNTGAANLEILEVKPG